MCGLHNIFAHIRGGNLQSDDYYSVAHMVQYTPHVTRQYNEELYFVTVRYK